MLVVPGAAYGQAFVASQPKPEFTIGPLLVRANVGPAHGPVEVSVLFSLVVPAPINGDTLAQDLYLLWRIRPQVLSVQFGYFTGWKAWAPLRFATLFFVLGNLAGPLITMLV
jgi:hypothetical protein